MLLSNPEGYYCCKWRVTSRATIIIVFGKHAHSKCIILLVVHIGWLKTCE